MMRLVQLVIVVCVLVGRGYGGGTRRPPTRKPTTRMPLVGTSTAEPTTVMPQGSCLEKFSVEVQSNRFLVTPNRGQSRFGFRKKWPNTATNVTFQPEPGRAGVSVAVVTSSEVEKAVR